MQMTPNFSSKLPKLFGQRSEYVPITPASQIMKKIWVINKLIWASNKNNLGELKM